MTTELIPANIQIPAHFASHAGKPSSLAAAISGGIHGGGVTYPRLSIKGSRFRVVVDGVETIVPSLALDVLVVASNAGLSKTYYAGAYVDGENKSPDCSSIGGITPDLEITAPVSTLCATCPMNAWGSKITPQGTKIKACTDQKRLAVVAADDPAGAVYLVQVTASALKGLNAFYKELEHKGISPEIIKTTLSFDATASYPKLQFGFGGFIDEATYNVIAPLFDSDKVMEIVGTPNESPAVIAAPVVAAPVAVPEPVVVVPAPVEEPPKAVGLGAAMAAAAQPVQAGVTTTPVAVPTPEPVAPVTVANVTPAPVVEEPAAVPVADSDTQKLADEIAGLLGQVADDA